MQRLVPLWEPFGASGELIRVLRAFANRNGQRKKTLASRYAWCVFRDSGEAKTPAGFSTNARSKIR